MAEVCGKKMLPAATGLPTLIDFAIDFLMQKTFQNYWFWSSSSYWFAYDESHVDLIEKRAKSIEVQAYWLESIADAQGTLNPQTPRVKREPLLRIRE